MTGCHREGGGGGLEQHQPAIDLQLTVNTGDGGYDNRSKYLSWISETIVMAACQTSSFKLIV
jgi:hypothetical protein